MLYIKQTCYGKKNPIYSETWSVMTSNIYLLSLHTCRLSKLTLKCKQFANAIIEHTTFCVCTCMYANHPTFNGILQLNMIKFKLTCDKEMCVAQYIGMMYQYIDK